MVCPDCLTEVEATHESCAGCGYVRPADGWTPDPLTGLILGGRYRLEGRLGAGGMASVFRASRIGALGGHVAVKVLAPRFARTVIARRFEREAQVVARLTNPYIVRVYDFDSFSFAGKGPQTSLYYIAMELIEGQTLGQLLRAQGKVNFIWGIDVLRQLARGLEEAHAQGIVHRDLKPSNIVLMRQRGSTHIKILDFGIAALSVREQEAGGQEKLTQTGFVSGTPDYMAPEQAVGDPSVGPPADMFSIGVIAFEMFSGRKPFEGPTMESLLARVTKSAPSLREVVSDASFPPELYRIVDKLLERDAKLRYQHAGELLDDLGRFPTLQTTPDFVPPAELLEQYATATDASRAAMQAPAGEQPEQRERTMTGPRAAQATTEVEPSGGSTRKRKSAAWVWVVALLVLGGAAAAVTVVVLQKSGPATTGEVPSLVMQTARGSLPSGMREHVVTVGARRVGIAMLEAAGATLRLPVPLRVAVDEGDKALRVVSGTATVTLARDGSKVGSVDGVGDADGRLVIELPTRPFEDLFEVRLALVLGGGSSFEAVVGYDAEGNTFVAR